MTVIGYKTYAQLPAEDNTDNVPADCPWVMVTVRDGEESWYVEQGFTIVTSEQYAALIASFPS